MQARCRRRRRLEAAVRRRPPDLGDPRQHRLDEVLLVVRGDADLVALGGQLLPCPVRGLVEARQVDARVIAPRDAVRRITQPRRGGAGVEPRVTDRGAHGQLAGIGLGDLDVGLGRVGFNAHRAQRAVLDQRDPGVDDLFQHRPQCRVGDLLERDRVLRAEVGAHVRVQPPERVERIEMGRVGALNLTGAQPHPGDAGAHPGLPLAGPGWNDVHEAGPRGEGVAEFGQSPTESRGRVARRHPGLVARNRVRLEGQQQRERLKIWAARIVDRCEDAVQRPAPWRQLDDRRGRWQQVFGGHLRVDRGQLTEQGPRPAARSARRRSAGAGSGEIEFGGHHRHAVLAVVDHRATAGAVDRLQLAVGSAGIAGVHGVVAVVRAPAASGDLVTHTIVMQDVHASFARVGKPETPCAGGRQVARWVESRHICKVTSAH